MKAPQILLKEYRRYARPEDLFNDAGPVFGFLVVLASLKIIQGSLM